MGNWSWILVLTRTGYAIPNLIYVFIHTEPQMQRRLVWDGVVWEVSALLALSPGMRVHLEAPWYPGVFRGDSSNEGWGILRTEADAPEIAAEARWGLGVGWPVADVEKDYSLGEQRFWWTPDPRVTHLDDRDFPAANDQTDSRGIIKGEARAWVVVISSPEARRPGDLQERIEEEAMLRSVPVAVVTVNASEDADTFRTWRKRVVARRVHFFLGVPGVSTWGRRTGSASRDGPKKIRSGRFPRGLHW